MKSKELSNGKTLIIRSANKEDAALILNYIHTIATESDNLTFGAGEFSMTVEEEEQFIKSVSLKQNALLLVAEVDGEIVGNLNFSGGHRKRIEHTGEFGVSVCKRYWGLGIGRSLIEYMIDWAKESGIIRKINLRVRADNESALGLYKKLGFEMEGKISREFQIDGEFYDAFHMGLCID